MKHTIITHPRGLDPFQAAKAWYLRMVVKLSWREIQPSLRAAGGGQPGKDAMLHAVRRVDAQRSTASFHRHGAATLSYGNCGRVPLLRDEHAAEAR